MSRPRALEGIRVVDFSWVRAGPWATRWLGAFGAKVIKIEWPENERGRLPSTTTPQNVEVNLNTSGNFNDTNVNKKSLTLNVRTAKGLEIVKRLIGISDIVANGSYALAASRGDLAVAAVLASLYPVVTALLARGILAERLRKVQSIGVIAALGGVLLLSS